METTEKQSIVDYKSQILDRMKSRYPDRDFDEVESPDGISSKSRLEESIAEALADDENRISELAEKQKTYEADAEVLSDIFHKSPRSAVFLTALAATGNPAVAIYKAYGSDALKALEDGKASEFITEMEAKDAAEREADARYEQEKEANLKASFEALDAWGNEKGLSDDDKVNVFMRFYNILQDAASGKYSVDLFEMGWKADHYGEDVENARHEGEVTGRNAKIQEMARKRRDTQSLPPSLYGQGVREEEKQKKVNDDPWMLKG